MLNQRAITSCSLRDKPSPALFSRDDICRACRGILISPDGCQRSEGFPLPKDEDHNHRKWHGATATGLKAHVTFQRGSYKRRGCFCVLFFIFWRGQIQRARPWQIGDGAEITNTRWTQSLPLISCSLQYFQTPRKTQQDAVICTADEQTYGHMTHRQLFVDDGLHTVRRSALRE